MLPVPSRKALARLPWKTTTGKWYFWEKLMAYSTPKVGGANDSESRTSCVCSWTIFADSEWWVYQGKAHPESCQGARRAVKQPVSDFQEKGTQATTMKPPGASLRVVGQCCFLVLPDRSHNSPRALHDSTTPGVKERYLSAAAPHAPGWLIYSVIATF